MIRLQLLVKDYLSIILKTFFESIAFLVPAVILGKFLQIMFYSGEGTIPFAPSAVAVVAFSIAFGKNYCFLEEDKYGLFQEEEEPETSEKTLTDYTDS